MVWSTYIVAKLYQGYGLAYINRSQTIPSVQFGYDLCTPNHTLGTVWREEWVCLLHRHFKIYAFRVKLLYRTTVKESAIPQKITPLACLNRSTATGIQPRPHAARIVNPRT